MFLHRWCIIIFMIVVSLSSCAANALSTPVCASFFDKDQSLTPDIFDDNRSLFSQTLPLTIGNALMLLIVAQLVAKGPEGLAESSFIVTAVSDPIATVIGTWVSFTEHDFIKRVRQYCGKLGEFGGRVAVNAGIGTAVITVTWLATKLFAGTYRHADAWRAVCAAGLVCTTFYPTLQLLQDGLFKKAPAAFDAASVTMLADEYPEEFRPAFAEKIQRGIAAGVPEDQVKRNLLSALSGFLLAKPYETSINYSSPLRSDRAVEELRIQLNLAAIIDQHSGASDVERVKKLRAKLVHRLLELHAAGMWRTDIEHVLAVGRGFSLEGTLALHRMLDERRRTHYQWLFASSVGTISFGVIIGGAVMVQAASHWFLHGELPWQMFGL